MIGLGWDSDKGGNMYSVRVVSAGLAARKLDLVLIVSHRGGTMST